jgi:NADH dehydrogenase
MSEDGRARLLLVGGGGGLVGRAVISEFSPEYRIRSIHRHFSSREAEVGVEWVAGDVASFTNWEGVLSGIDVVLNVAWYRWGSERKFRRLQEGLHRLLSAAQRSEVTRFLHVSVPEAPESLESDLPYLTYKRKFDRELAAGGLSFRILRSSMLFGPGDKLLTVILRSIQRYPFFPMFGDGLYHVNPLSVFDLARALRLEAARRETGTIGVGGPVIYPYRDLTDLMYRLLGKRPRYWNLSRKGSLRLAGWLEHLGSSLLYSYEVEWLLSDRLGVPPYEGLDRPLTRVEPFLQSEVNRLIRPRAEKG